MFVSPYASLRTATCMLAAVMLTANTVDAFTAAPLALSTRAVLRTAARSAPPLAGPGMASRRRGLLLAKASAVEDEPAIRIGHGWDIHRMSTPEKAGQGCVIGGVTVDCEYGVEAHSDGDVLYHSLTDAILGALTLPDIGQLFPDTDPRWRGCDSEKFLEEAWRLMDERGYKVSNVDITLILQQPRVSPIKDKMKANVVRVLQTAPGRVNIKARTHEKVDSIGESRALSCHTVILMDRK